MVCSGPIIWAEMRNLYRHEQRMGGANGAPHFRDGIINFVGSQEAAMAIRRSYLPGEYK